MLLKTRELDYNVYFSISHFTQFSLFISALKAARDMQLVTYEGSHMRLSNDSSTETF